MTEKQLSKGAKLANELTEHILMSGRFDNMKVKDIIDEYLLPIFGIEVVDELKDLYIRNNNGK